MKYNDRGEELPDDTPIDIPLHFRRPPTLQEQIQRMVRTELSNRAAAVGFETFEESDDFDIGDEDEFHSAHELTPMQEEFHMLKRDKSVLDKVPGKSDNSNTVNSDRSKESSDVQQSGAGGNSKGADSAAKVG